MVGILRTGWKPGYMRGDGPRHFEIQRGWPARESTTRSLFSNVQPHTRALSSTARWRNADDQLASRRLEIFRRVPLRYEPCSGLGRVSGKADQNYRTGSSRKSKRRAGENRLSDSDVAART